MSDRPYRHGPGQREHGLFLPGQLVNVIVELDSIPNAVVVPSDAVNEGPDGSYIYVVAGGKAVQHNVRIVFDDSKNVAIEGDVKPGDQVIVEGQLRVDPNGTVNVLPSKNGTQAGPNTATDAVQDEERRAASAGALRIVP